MARKNSKKQSWKISIITYSLIGIFSAFIIFFVANQAVLFFKKNELFMIKEIVKDPNLPSLDMGFLDRLKGRSIFTVDLRSMASRLQARNPQVDHFRILRKFPDRIYIVAKTREPFAILSIRHQEAVIDEEGVVLSSNGPAPRQLPVVIGVGAIKVVKEGRPVSSDEVRTAIEVIRDFSANRQVAAYGMSVVDVSNLSKIVCTLSDGLKVIVDQDSLPQKFRTLEFLLTEGKLKLDEILYIDLRFKEPVLGKKTN